jgi:hypothetical protein
VPLLSPFKIHSTSRRHQNMTIAFEGSTRVWETISAMPDANHPRQGARKPPTRGSNMKHCSVIGPTTVEGMTACPCCNRHLKDGRQTVGETRLASRHGSLFKDDASDTDSIEDLEDEDHMMPGVLAQGVAYTIKQDLVQGWVHKKGTGMDWLCSRAWKPRWAVLSVSLFYTSTVSNPICSIL